MIIGTPLDPRNLTRRFQQAVAAAGLSRCRFHDLRHTAATLMLTGGVPAKIVATRLGHASAAFTMDTYGHVAPEMQEAAATVTDGILEGLLNASEAVDAELTPDAASVADTNEHRTPLPLLATR